MVCDRIAISRSEWPVYAIKRLAFRNLDFLIFAAKEVHGVGVCVEGTAWFADLVGGFYEANVAVG